MDHYYRSTPSSDSSEWRSSSHRGHASISSSLQDSETESILISFMSPLTSPTSPIQRSSLPRSPPLTSPFPRSPPAASSLPRSPPPTSPLPRTPSSASAQSTGRPVSASTDQVTHIALNPSVAVSFARGNRMFKLRYTQIDVYRTISGELKSIEMNDFSRSQGTLIHQFPNSKQAIPHLEQPAASEHAALRVSFLGTQTIKTAQTLFQTEPSYCFENEKDCIRFQEALLQQQVVLVAGVAELKSKGRGEECISQNLRVLRAPSGSFGMFYFANSQRKEKKRYVCIPMTAVDRIEPGKKGSKTIFVRLRPNFDLLAQLKTLSIKFLEESDYRTFYSILCQVVGLHAEG